MRLLSSAVMSSSGVFTVPPGDDRAVTSSGIGEVYVRHNKLTMEASSVLINLGRLEAQLGGATWDLRSRLAARVYGPPRPDHEASLIRLRAEVHDLGCSIRHLCEQFSVIWGELNLLRFQCFGLLGVIPSSQ
jgi:hypothetical protein